MFIKRKHEKYSCFVELWYSVRGRDVMRFHEKSDIILLLKNHKTYHTNERFTFIGGTK